MSDLGQNELLRLGENHFFYSSFPNYIKSTFNKENIVIDIAKEYASDFFHFLDLPLFSLAPLLAASIIPGPPPVITPYPALTMLLAISTDNS